mmetsp:Transcript_1174/g.1892  ORF Transcript_1174/g.1892 Transcript_1174/m.1892 type:complete len:84 (+) Transcript_1174:126-377(+)
MMIKKFHKLETSGSSRKHAACICLNSENLTVRTSEFWYAYSGGSLECTAMFLAIGVRPAPRLGYGDGEDMNKLESRLCVMCGA